MPNYIKLLSALPICSALFFCAGASQAQPSNVDHELVIEEGKCGEPVMFTWKVYSDGDQPRIVDSTFGPTTSNKFDSRGLLQRSWESGGPGWWFRKNRDGLWEMHSAKLDAERVKCWISIPAAPLTPPDKHK